MDLGETLLKILRCPESGQDLRMATPDELAAINAGREPPMEAALVREDGRKAYPIRGGFPILLIDEAADCALQAEPAD
jgi:uncharacterized protein YbaR (Trm112 family)